jgi:FkbM family methyltransferase
MLKCSIVRFLKEYRALREVLSAGDRRAFFAHTVRNGLQILRTKTLSKVDAGMSRDLEVHYHDRHFILPLANIDAILAPYSDNPTFGNLREMVANDCYLRLFRLPLPIQVVLDLGANRGLFSLIALMALDAEVVMAVEPLAFYEPIMRLLLEVNGCGESRMIRYNKFIASSSSERHNPSKYISINAIREQQQIARFGIVKMDIEGGELDIFREPDWLSHVDNVTMELHHFAGDLQIIPLALKEYGFQTVVTDQFGEACHFGKATFLYASCTGALR